MQQRVLELAPNRGAVDLAQDVLRSERVERRAEIGSAERVERLEQPAIESQTGARLGDFAVVLNVRNGKTSNAIFADVGTMGEGSVALADNLGLWSNAREGGTRRGIFYLVFSGSGNGKPRSIDEINEQAESLLRDWGGTERMLSCSAN